jgi:hypothetical protein
MCLEIGHQLVPFGSNHFCETTGLESEQNKNSESYFELYSQPRLYCGTALCDCAEYSQTHRAREEATIQRYTMDQSSTGHSRSGQEWLMAHLVMLPVSKLRSVR